MPLDDTKTTGKTGPTAVVITPPRFERAAVLIRGTAPYMQHKFSEKSRLAIEDKHREGSRSKKGSKKDARDFEAEWLAATHFSKEGWPGIPAPSFRNALIDACRMAGFQMTRAKMSIFVEADGYDAEDGTPLIKIIGTVDRFSKPMPTRNETGVVDLRARPQWSEWECIVPLRWDADQFSAADVINLLARAGVQVGIGEGRPYSKNSNGLGLGTFEVASDGK
jgi:hypothetical protein